MLASIARNTVSVERQKTIGGERNVDGGTLRNLATPVVPATILIKLRNSDTGSVEITGTDSTGGSSNGNHHDQFKQAGARYQVVCNGVSCGNHRHRQWQSHSSVVPWQRWERCKGQRRLVHVFTVPDTVQSTKLAQRSFWNG